MLLSLTRDAQVQPPRDSSNEDMAASSPKVCGRVVVVALILQVVHIVLNFLLRAWLIHKIVILFLVHCFCLFLPFRSRPMSIEETPATIISPAVIAMIREIPRNLPLLVRSVSRYVNVL